MTTVVSAQGYIGLSGGIGCGKWDTTRAFDKMMSLTVGFSRPNIFLNPENENWHDLVRIEYDQSFFFNHHDPAYFGARAGYEVQKGNWSYALLLGGFYWIESTDNKRIDGRVGGFTLRTQWKLFSCEVSKIQCYQFRFGVLAYFKEKN